MSRHFPDWLAAYTEFTGALEAPTPFHYFSGVAAISGALSRKVWFDMGHFKWYPNFYIIIVAKPGIVNKSTSINIAMDMLREIPGAHIGPSSITWQALVQHMGNIAENVEIDGDFHTMCASSFVASELGTLIDFTNREMIDVLVDLWDGKTGSWEKMTKMSGVESVVNPWISFIAGTTPTWLAQNVPEGAIGGGFCSRCLFIYGSEKRRIIPYPFIERDSFNAETRQKLIADLEAISLIKGEYVLEPAALRKGIEWYTDLWTNPPEHLLGSRFEGYLARKQTHLHKLCMVIAASRRDERIILIEDLDAALTLLASQENDMILALNNVGRSAASIVLEMFVDFVAKHNAGASHENALCFLARFMQNHEAEGMLQLAINTGLVKAVQTGMQINYVATGKSLI